MNEHPVADNTEWTPIVIAKLIPLRWPLLVHAFIFSVLVGVGTGCSTHATLIEHRGAERLKLSTPFPRPAVVFVADNSAPVTEYYMGGEGYDISVDRNSQQQEVEKLAESLSQYNVLLKKSLSDFAVSRRLLGDSADYFVLRPERRRDTSSKLGDTLSLIFGVATVGILPSRSSARHEIDWTLYQCGGSSNLLRRCEGTRGYAIRNTTWNSLSPLAALMSGGPTGYGYSFALTALPYWEDALAAQNRNATEAFRRDSLGPLTQDAMNTLCLRLYRYTDYNPKSAYVLFGNSELYVEKGGRGSGVVLAAGPQKLSVMFRTQVTRGGNVTEIRSFHSAPFDCDFKAGNVYLVEVRGGKLVLSNLGEMPNLAPVLGAYLMEN